jgi:hypothetical protein
MAVQTAVKLGTRLVAPLVVLTEWQMGYWKAGLLAEMKAVSKAELKAGQLVEHWVAVKVGGMAERMAA